MTAAPHDLREARGVVLSLALESLRVAAPGLSEAIQGHVARSIALKVEGKVLATLTADLAQARAERDAAIRAMSEHAMARGEAEGALRAAEMPGVVDGWRERAEKAEAENARLREALRSIEHEGPATSEYTSAHVMAEIARYALKPAEAAHDTP